MTISLVGTFFVIVIWFGVVKLGERKKQGKPPICSADGLGASGGMRARPAEHAHPTLKRAEVVS